MMDSSTMQPAVCSSPSAACGVDDELICRLPTMLLSEGGPRRAHNLVRAAAALVAGTHVSPAVLKVCSC